jgi:hypothetical protein
MFSLSSLPHLNLSIIYLSFALSLPRYSGISSAIHLSYFPLYLDSLILFLLFCLAVYLPLSICSTFIHISFAFNLSTSSLALSVSLVVFLSLLLHVFSFFLALFPSIHFVFKLCRSLSRFHSQLISLALFPHYVT